MSVKIDSFLGYEDGFLNMLQGYYNVQQYHIRQASEKVSGITGVPADRLEAAAKALVQAKKPLVIAGSALGSGGAGRWRGSEARVDRESEQFERAEQVDGGRGRTAPNRRRRAEGSGRGRGAASG